MASFNKVLLMGNLTRDPELRYTPNGAAVASFGLAVNRKYKQGDDWKEEVCYVDITVWGKQGENCAQYLSKGSGAFIEGRLNYQSWESDGQRRNKLEVVANNVQFLGRPGGKPPADMSGEGPGPGSQAGGSDDVPF